MIAGKSTTVEPARMLSTGTVGADVVVTIIPAPDEKSPDEKSRLHD
jgi:hypothetical protein